MICSEVREYLFAFLDNELAAELSLELQGHLEHCPRCAHDAETERAVRHHLQSAVNASINAPRQHRLRWPRLVAGFAAVLVLALAVRMVIKPDAQPLFDQLLVESGEFLQRQRPINITSADRSVVTDWLRRETKLHLTLPAVEAGPWTLVGGRRCTLAGRPAAFVLYEFHDVPAALVVVSGDQCDVDGMEPVHRGDDTRWTSRRNGLNVVVCQRGALLLHAVSTLPAERLDDLVRAHNEDR